MKKTIYFLSVIICMSSCTNTSDDLFNKNCETVRDYVKSFCAENIDYDKFYAENAIIRGTTLGEFNMELDVEDRKIAHKQMWEKYDFNVLEPFDILPGVNAETKELDGSARMYTNLQVTLTENQRSIIIPMYESYDFDENGKIQVFQYFGDFTAALLSLED